MCAISCAMVLARSLRSASVARERNTSGSRNVTQPGFSIAPALNSGTKAWWYWPHG